MEQPTKKAISERILRLRKQVKEAADVRAASRTGSSTTNTPNSKTSNITRTPTSGRGGKSGQRRSAPGSAQGTPSRPAKRTKTKETTDSSDDEPSSHDSGIGKSNVKEQNGFGAKVKEEAVESQAVDFDETRKYLPSIHCYF